MHDMIVSAEKELDGAQSVYHLSPSEQACRLMRMLPKAQRYGWKSETLVCDGLAIGALARGQYRITFTAHNLITIVYMRSDNNKVEPRLSPGYHYTTMRHALQGTVRMLEKRLKATKSYWANTPQHPGMRLPLTEEERPVFQHALETLKMAEKPAVADPV